MEQRKKSVVQNDYRNDSPLNIPERPSKTAYQTARHTGNSQGSLEQLISYKIMKSKSLDKFEDDAAEMRYERHRTSQPIMTEDLTKQENKEFKHTRENMEIFKKSHVIPSSNTNESNHSSIENFKTKRKSILIEKKPQKHVNFIENSEKSENETTNLKGLSEDEAEIKGKSRKIPHISRQIIKNIDITRVSRVKSGSVIDEDTTRDTEKINSAMNRHKSSDVLRNSSVSRPVDPLPDIIERSSQKDQEVWFSEFLIYVNKNIGNVNIPNIPEKKIDFKSDPILKLNLTNVPKNTLQSSMSVTSLTDRNRYFNAQIHEKSQNIIMNLIKDRHKLDEITGFAIKKLNLPSVDLEKRKNDRKSISDKIEATPSKRYLSYYLEKIGNPFLTRLSHKLNPDIQPSNLVFMGKRLGIRASMSKYESIESDLL